MIHPPSISRFESRREGELERYKRSQELLWWSKWQDVVYSVRHMSSAFLKIEYIVDNVLFSQSVLNREIVEGRRYGAGEGRGVRRGPCSNAGIWGASFAPLMCRCVAAPSESVPEMDILFLPPADTSSRQQPQIFTRNGPFLFSVSA